MLNTWEFLRRYMTQAVDTTPKAPKEPETFISIAGGATFCIYCKETLPQTPEYTKLAIQQQHRKTKRHVKLLQAMQYHGVCAVYNSKEWRLYGVICKKHLRAAEKVKEHTLGAVHKSWLQEMENLLICESELLTTSCVSIEDFLACQSEFAYCRVCDIDIDCNAKKIFVHLQSNAHRERFLEHLKPCTGLFPIENNKVMLCKVCDLLLENDVEVLLDHLNDCEPHGRWFYDIDIMAQQDISVLEFLTDVKETKATCQRCDLKIKADIRSVQAHVHSEAHRLRYKKNSQGAVKSLAIQNIWPFWCHWNFFGHPDLGDHDFWLG